VKPTRALIAAICLFVSIPAFGGTQRVFSAQDAITMNRFNPLRTRIAPPLFEFSPNRRCLVFVTSRGVLNSDSIESNLWLYDVREIEGALRGLRPFLPSPRLLATVSAIPRQFSFISYSSMITNVQWASDSHSIYFLAQTGNGDRVLRRVRLGSGKIDTLTPLEDDVTQYAFGIGTVVYTVVHSQAEKSSPESSQQRINQDAVAVNGVPIANILFSKTAYHPQSTQLWIRRGTETRRITDFSRNDRQQLVHDPLNAALSVSPGGHYVVRLLPVQNIPDSWTKYTPAPEEPNLRIKPEAKAGEMGATFVNQYAITDTRTDQTRILIPAPVGRYLGYFYEMESKWSPDGQYVILTNTFLPIFNASPVEMHRRQEPCVAAIVNIRTRDIDCLRYFDEQAASTRLEKVRFSNDITISLTIDLPSNERAIQSYAWTKGHWALLATRNHELPPSSNRVTVPNGKISVGVHQNLNDPPTLEAMDNTSKATAIWNPNPQLCGMEWGKASLFDWTDRDGHRWTGGLIYPIHYVAGKRYPLVIQMYSFNPDEFMTDGMAPTAMPARTIADAGMFYLQADKSPGHTWNEQEAETNLEGTLAAIDTLNAAGLIDPEKVGLIGFSFTAWYVENELVKAPKRFAAATIAEGPNYSYTQYFLWCFENPQLRRQADWINGGPPFGPNLQRWVMNAPSFHLDQVRTPVRIEAMGPDSLMNEWELYASLYLQNKPVDLIYYPTGQHQLQKPLARLASAQGNVDWFRFWLQAYENPDPAKRQQYLRWARMKEKKMKNK
jgi:dienelactone hydrolase